ncbi:Protein of unknown function DM4/12 [Trinorchestia longiramus]|nr:Protein of unknown function DM4/12 [Trinorchestia longiramus]
MVAAVGVTHALLAVLLVVSGEALETWKEYQHRMAKTTAKKHHTPPNLTPELKDLHARQKRSIAFPTDSTFTITPILCVPVFNMGDIAGVLDVELPFTIKLPNETDINGLGRSSDRLGIYSLLEESIERLGVSGRACLLRAVCEVAETPLREDGLLGEVLNIVLSASAGLHSPEMEEYTKAEYRGLHYGNCWSAYPDCPVSIFRVLDS